MLNRSIADAAAERERSEAPGADRSLAIWVGGAATGVLRSVICGWVSQAVLGWSAGRLPPGGRPGWVPTIFVSDWPNRPGWSEYVSVPPLPRTRMYGPLASKLRDSPARPGRKSTASTYTGRGGKPFLALKFESLSVSLDHGRMLFATQLESGRT